MILCLDPGTAAARAAEDLRPGHQDPQRVPFPAAMARKQAIRAAGRVNGQGISHRQPEQAESGRQLDPSADDLYQDPEPGTGAAAG